LFFDVTKPASICNQKKFRNHENDSFQITRQSLNGVLISLEYPYFFRRTKFGSKLRYQWWLGGLRP